MGRNGLEVEAQKEAAKFLNKLGWAYKADTEMVCLKCFTVNYPKHSGMFDYLAVIRSDNGPYPIGVEIKATPDSRWRFADWSDEQRAWSQAWQNKVGSTQSNAFLYLQMRKGAVNLRDVDMRRRVWFIPHFVVLDTERKLLETGMKSIPINAAARTRGRDDFNQELTAEKLFQGWELLWIPNFGWWIPYDSNIWEQIRTLYYDPDTAKEFSEQFTNPDIAAKRNNKS